MREQSLLSSWWVRLVVFLWMIVFPILFIAIPAVEMAREEKPVSMAPLWALAVWLLAPLAVSIVWKYAGVGKEARK